MKKLLLGVLLVSTFAMLTGCETIKGLGKDLENTGDNIWDGVTQKKNSTPDL